MLEKPPMVLPRWLLLLFGWLLTALALIGALLPLVPTTPFLLLACYCFARSAPRVHAWILNVPIFGKYLRQWDETHTVPQAAKYKGIFVILFSFGLSAYWAGILWVRILLTAIALAASWFVWRLPHGVCQGESEVPADELP